MTSYMTRAMKARDPRYAQVLGKLGYKTRDEIAEPANAPSPKPADIADLRKEYETAVGKKPFNGWDAATLARKIAEHLAKA